MTHLQGECSYKRANGEDPGAGGGVSTSVKCSFAITPPRLIELGVELIGGGGDVVAPRSEVLEAPQHPLRLGRLQHDALALPLYALLRPDQLLLAPRPATTCVRSIKRAARGNCHSRNEGWRMF